MLRLAFAQVRHLLPVRCKLPMGNERSASPWHGFTLLTRAKHALRAGLHFRRCVANGCEKARRHCVSSIFRAEQLKQTSRRLRLVSLFYQNARAKLQTFSKRSSRRVLSASPVNSALEKLLAPRLARETRCRAAFRCLVANSVHIAFAARQSTRTDCAHPMR